jgi:glycosyltransferase involved in cell wall biosynthesis
MIGCPVRNRAWILQDYLHSLLKMDYPSRLIEYCFIINDCQDQTPEILADFAATAPSPVYLVNINLNTRYGHKRGEYSFKNLALLRNLLLERFLQSMCQYLFSVDSDILVPPNTLRDLMADRCDIVSALVCNGHLVGQRNLFNVLEKTPQGNYVHIKKIPFNRLFEVDCTGAAYLISRQVIEDYGVRYSAEYGAEDIGFCQRAKQQGIKIFCDSRVECIHVMQEYKKD